MGRRGLWTGKRLRDISQELGRLGWAVCPSTVRRLLGEVDYALHANRKSLSGQTSPFRDQQFGLLNHQRQEFSRRRLSDYQCRHQEEGTGGPVQKQRSGMESGASGGARP
jgi:hypothetical protein